MSSLVIHFDGAITVNHRVSARTLGKTLGHLQSAIDRAYLDVQYGSVWKHARLKRSDYAETEFLLGTPREGGFIIDLLRDQADDIVERIKAPVLAALAESKAEGNEQFASLKGQLETRRNQIQSQVVEQKSFAELLQNPDPKSTRAYGDRSITKEVDQVLALIRNERSGVSYLEIEFRGRENATATFNPAVARAFHQVVSRRLLGEPVIYTVTMRSIDEGNAYQGMRAKVKNLDNDREVILFIQTQEDFNSLRPYVGGGRRFRFLGCPILEYDSFDPNGGDVFFVSLLGEE